MKDEVFSVPPKIYEPQRRYERAPESLKKKRKLTWIQGVELQPEDHVIQIPDAARGRRLLSTNLAAVERTNGESTNSPTAQHG